MIAYIKPKNLLRHNQKKISPGINPEDIWRESWEPNGYSAEM